jgi:hypothetical protein
MPCNYSGQYDPAVAAKFGIVDFDWSNEKDVWVNDSPMTCMERLVTQAQVIKKINPDTKIWVYRESVAAQPWYTDVRAKLTDPKTEHWFMKFDSKANGSYRVPRCDKNFNPPRCSDLYHDQVQTPNFPTGDGACSKPCDCGVPCGRYLWDTRNPDLVDWLVNEHLTGNSSVGRSDGLISGIFLDDDISATGGFAENCKLNDCEHDMGLSSKDMVDLANGWKTMMNRTQAKVLELGGFDWRMFSPGAGTCDGPPFAKADCATYMRKQCVPNGSLQTSAMMYGLGEGCKLVTDHNGDPIDLNQHLASFLLLRGPYAWLGWAWVGCAGSRGPGFKPNDGVPPIQYGTLWDRLVLSTDYGTPISHCTETAPNSGIFTREWSRVTISMDCSEWEPSYKWKVPTPPLPPSPPPSPPPPTPAPPGELVLRNYVAHGAVEGRHDTAPCAARSSGSCTAFTSAGYTLVRAEVLVWAKQIEEPGVSMMKRVDGIYNSKKDDNSLSDGSSTFSPAGYANETSMGETFFVYKSPATVTIASKGHKEHLVAVALVPIDVYYNEALGDHWVLASAASRTEAMTKGYVRVGGLGFGLPL